ncbi:hypothetical protein [Gluconobacter cerinus]|uniref:hypothetical protein n=1 Tax=Gluconobacter cerinus TaxID=38307 RepID=UPI0020138675|nr:hypothetical protein [Gluconobacter cerinus]
MKDRITSAKIDLVTGRPLPAGVEYRGKGQYRARKRIAGGERIHQTFSSANLEGSKNPVVLSLSV